MAFNFYSQKNEKPREEPFVPLPSSSRLKLKNQNCNFSLYSPRMVSWKFARQELKTDESVVSTLCEQSEKSFSGLRNFIKGKQNLQTAYLASLKTQEVPAFELRAKTTSPFITGLGAGHPTETGMILDRNTGVPYIPASSIKGVLRLSCAINLAKKNEAYRKSGIVPDNDEKLVRYFGSMSQNEKEASRGQLIFLDAYPAGIPKLKVDIMNPHFSKYYSGENKQPVETENPVPIKFLTLEKGTQFIFRCAFLPLGNEILSEENRLEIENDVDEMFKTAFEKVGFGGKTAIGYGRFKTVEEQK